MVAWMLDYKDHNGERQREVIKHPHGPWKTNDQDGIEMGRIHAIQQANKLAAALDSARLNGDRRPMLAHSISVRQMVEQYLHLDLTNEPPNKAAGMLRYLDKLPASKKPLPMWTRHDSMQFVQLMANHLAQQTLMGYFGVFKRAWRYAYHSEMVQRNPTTDVKAKGGRPSQAEDKHLRDHELRQLLATPFREDVRGIFTFMLVAGAYYADLHKFRRSNIVTMPDGSMRMYWKRQKNARPTWMSITEELMESATGDGDQLFPRMPWSIVYFNIQLKRWALKAGLFRDGLPLQLSQKWARKTCGDNGRRLTTDPFILRDLMAHKELKSTQHYVQPNADEVVEASERWRQKVYREATT